MRHLFATLMVSITLGGCSWADYNRSLNQTPPVSEGKRKVYIETSGASTISVPAMGDNSPITITPVPDANQSEIVPVPLESLAPRGQKLYKVKTVDGKYYYVWESQIVRTKDGHILIKEKP